MKPHKLDERLKRIAESMEDLPIEGTTRIAWSCLTEREKLLYDKTELIAQKPFYHIKPSDSELLARALSTKPAYTRLSFCSRASSLLRNLRSARERCSKARCREKGETLNGSMPGMRIAKSLERWNKIRERRSSSTLLMSFMWLPLL